MFCLKKYLVFAITVVFLLQSFVIAVAQPNEKDISGVYILCAEHGLIATYVDGQGEPFIHDPYCIDCVISLCDIEMFSKLSLVETQLLSTVYVNLRSNLIDFDVFYFKKAREPPV